MALHLCRSASTTLAAAAVLGSGLACSSVTATEDGPGHSLLFIGNSLTYTNDLPEVVARVAEAAQDPVRVAMVAGGNLAVIDHVNGSTDAVAQIDRGKWSFVVLQQGPTPAGVCRDTLIIAAMRLAPHIRQAGARPVLFLPWARQGSPQWLDFASESATLAARSVGGIVAPIGTAWRDALSADPTTPLYAPDGYHPAPAGTLLAALTLYDRLLGRDVRTIPVELLAALPGVDLGRSQLRAMVAAAHMASTSLPADPPTPAPADTTKVSGGGGPC
jgi:hypothetical protein